MHSNPYCWTKEHLDHIITEGKHRILKLENYAEAFRIVDRMDFVPLKYKDYAYDDKDIEIGYGEFLTKPTTIAKIIELLSPQIGGRYLEVGSGTGYLLALLSNIVGTDGHIIGLERILGLVSKIRENLSKYKLNNVEVVFKDGYTGYADMGPYNGIIISGMIGDLPDIFKTQIKVGGKILYINSNYELCVLTKKDQVSISEEIHPGFIFKKITQGVE